MAQDPSNLGQDGGNLCKSRYLEQADMTAFTQKTRNAILQPSNINASTIAWFRSLVLKPSCFAGNFLCIDLKYLQSSRLFCLLRISYRVNRQGYDQKARYPLLALVWVSIFFWSVGWGVLSHRSPRRLSFPFFYSSLSSVHLSIGPCLRWYLAEIPFPVSWLRYTFLLVLGWHIPSYKTLA